MKKFLLIGLSLILIVSIVAIFLNGNGQLFQGDLGQIIKVRRIPLPEPQIITDTKVIRSSDVIPVSNQIFQKINSEYKSISKEIQTGSTLKITEIDNIQEQILDKFEGQFMPFPRINTNIPQIPKNPLKDTTSNWTHLGIQGTGVIRSIDYDHKNPSHLVMATPGHLYQTYDLGNSWQVIDFPPNNLQVIAIDPNDGNHYLVLAGQKSLFESKDSGNKWVLIYQFNNVTIDTGGGKPFSLFWANNTINARAAGVNIISKDNGKTWNAYNITADEWTNPTKINPNGFGLLTSQKGLYETTDFGKNWNKIYTLNDSNQFNYSDLTPFSISDDGRFIIATWLSNDSTTIHAVISKDGGSTWDNFIPIINGNSFTPQDIVIDPQNPNHLLLFVYMNGIFESFDQGKSFSPAEIKSYENMTILKQPDTTSSIMITPLDLRFAGIQAETDKDLQNYFIPTDQGIFLYDEVNKTLKNLAPNLYLGDTGKQLGVTSCPMIYAGLWHVGHFIINSDGSISGNNDGEMDRAIKGQEAGCRTPILVFGLYNAEYYENNILDINKRVSLLSNISFPNLTPIIYSNGWWYAISKATFDSPQDFIRLSQNLDTKQVLTKPDPSVYYFTFYIDQSTPTPTFWVMDTQSMKIWKTTDPINNSWTLVSSPPCPGCQITYNNNMLFSDNNILVWGNIYKPSGFYISHDQGKSSTLLFPHMLPSSNMIKDSQGRIFIGLSPHIYDPDSDNLNQNGVWYSSDEGYTWNRFGTGSEKSIITGLTIDDTKNTIYATTSDESILQINLATKTLNPLPQAPQPICPGPACPQYTPIIDLTHPQINEPIPVQEQPQIQQPTINNQLNEPATSDLPSIQDQTIPLPEQQPIQSPDIQTTPFQLYRSNVTQNLQLR